MLDDSQAFKKFLEESLRTIKYPIQKAGSVIYDSIVGKDYNLSFNLAVPNKTSFDGVGAHVGDAIENSPREFMQNVVMAKPREAKIAKGVMNNLKPVVHELYEERVGNLPGSITPE